MAKSRHWLGRQRGAIYRLLLKATDAGPFDGGCVTFAHALRLRYGGDVVALCRADGGGDHTALAVNGIFLDGDGPAESAPALLARFNANERAATVAIRPISEGDLPDAPHCEVTARAIAQLLP